MSNQDDDTMWAGKESTTTSSDPACAVDCEDIINHVKAAAKQDMSHIDKMLSKQQNQIDSLVEAVKPL